MSREKIREHNAIIKDLRAVDVLFGYCYPSTYRAGMTSLATHLFYSVLNSRNDTSCERYFRYDVPDPGRSIETGRLLHENQIVGFSLTYEEDVLHIVQMLEKGKIPVLVNQRNDANPIVIAGGPVVSANPEPYVDFVDAFVIGEGDLVIHDLVSAVKESESRNHALSLFAEIPGVYVPSLEQSSVDRLIMVDLDEIFHPTVQIVPDVPEGAHREPVFGKSFLTEVTRGCGHSCKFCLTGHICRPRRVRSLERIIDILETGLERTPVRKVSLIGSSLGDHDRLEDIAEFVVSQDIELSVPSLRADSVTANLLASLVKGGQRTLTIAPETGSSELRRSMGKGLDDSDIENAVKLATEAGLFSVKLYYIVGLPDETENDVRAIAGLTKKLAMISKTRITASVNPFIPKANTRLERHGQLPIEELRRRLKIINSELRNIPRVSVESLDPRNARIQAALSLGDRSIGRVIHIAAAQGGLSGWRRAEKETGVAFFSIANDSERLTGKLPWSFLRTH